MYYSDATDFINTIDSTIGPVSSPLNALTYIELSVNENYAVGGAMTYQISFGGLTGVPPPYSYRDIIFSLLPVTTDYITYGNARWIASIPDYGTAGSSPYPNPPENLSEQLIPIRFYPNGEFNSIGEIVGYVKIDNSFFTPSPTTQTWAHINGTIHFTKQTVTTTTTTSTPIPPPVLPPITENTCYLQCTSECNANLSPRSSVNIDPYIKEINIVTPKNYITTFSILYEHFLTLYSIRFINEATPYDSFYWTFNLEEISSDLKVHIYLGGTPYYVYYNGTEIVYLDVTNPFAAQGVLSQHPNSYYIGNTWSNYIGYIVLKDLSTLTTGAGGLFTLFCPSETTTTTTPIITTTTTTTISPNNPNDPNNSTTTTTTTLPTRPFQIKNVETIQVFKDREQLGTDSSDSKGTINTINSMALSFGSLAPGETSATMIIYLKVPTSSAINNIRLALTDCGGLTFGEVKFGVETHAFLDYNIIPSDEFLGINDSDDPNSPYNIDIGNNSLYNSEYVYLNVAIPRDQIFRTGTIRLKWYFDFA